MNLYDVILIDLSQERVAGQGGDKEPFSFETQRDALRVLFLDGEADISISVGATQEYFPLREKLRIKLSQGERKTIKITNAAQAGKQLKILLSNREDFELIGG